MQIPKISQKALLATIITAVSFHRKSSTTTMTTTPYFIQCTARMPCLKTAWLITNAIWHHFVLSVCACVCIFLLCYLSYYFATIILNHVFVAIARQFPREKCKTDRVQLIFDILAYFSQCQCFCLFYVFF